MKRILLATVVLLLFSFSAIIVQTSCENDADAAPNEEEVTTQLNKIIYLRQLNAQTDYAVEMWSVNYDGTGLTKLNILLPTGFEIHAEGGVRVSPDGKKIFFSAFRNQTHSIFSCHIDGSNVTKIIDDPNVYRLLIGAAY